VGNKPLGQLIVLVGLILVVVGLVAMRGWLGWFGHLPGDVRIEKPSMRVYVPIVSMLVISILFTVLSYVLRRIL